MIIKINDKEFNFDGYGNINEIAKAFDEALTKAYQQGKTDGRAEGVEEYRQRLNNAFEPVEEHEQMELEVVIADVNRLAKVLKEQNR